MNLLSTVVKNVPAAKENPTTISIDTLGVRHKPQNEIYLIVENLSAKLEEADGE